MQYSFETAICLEKSCSVALPIAMVHRKEWHIRSGYQATSNSHISSKQVNSPRPCKSKHTAAAEQTWQLRNARLLYHIFRWGSFSNRRSYSIARWSHRCPFPIDWLINRGVSSEAPLTTGFYDDRWDEPVTGPPIFTKRTSNWVVSSVLFRLHLSDVRRCCQGLLESSGGTGAICCWDRWKKNEKNRSNWR